MGQQIVPFAPTTDNPKPSLPFPHSPIPPLSPTSPPRRLRLLELLPRLERPVLLPADAELGRGEEASAAETIERGAGHAVLFSRSDAPLSEAAFDLPGDGAVRLLVCGLAPGAWTVETPDGPGLSMTVAAEANCLYFRASPGRCRLCLQAK